ncbi:hypothetical protein F5Y08DRAFT_138350 [Xylaria arbuscula]|nr:hypothetical protein F5Y08DRAFT_138350 [Xylaria arbuscula]
MNLTPVRVYSTLNAAASHCHYIPMRRRFCSARQQVATICKFMQGIHNWRMKIIFDFAIDLVHSAPIASQSVMTSSTASKPVIVETCLTVLSKMINCNTGNIIDETFKVVVQQIDSILQNFNKTSDNYLMISLQRGLDISIAASSSEAQTTQIIKYHKMMM